MPPKLDQVHPELLKKIDLVLRAMEVLGHPMKIVQGVRTTAEQQALFAQGRTKPGPRVTNADGVRHKSNHQIRDGWGWAVDCAFKGPDPFAEHHPWGLYGEAVKAVGLNWGGSWVTPDRPHAEWKP